MFFLQPPPCIDHANAFLGGRYDKSCNLGRCFTVVLKFEQKLKYGRKLQGFAASL
jgi:hypothetical protein